MASSGAAEENRPLVADELGVALFKRATNHVGFDKPEGPNSFPVRRAS